MDFHVIIHLIYTVDFSEIASCLALTTFLSPKLMSTKLIHAKGFFIQYLLWNMGLFFLINVSVLKAVSLPNKVSYPSFPKCKSCPFSSSSSSALFPIGSVSSRGQTFPLLSWCTKAVICPCCIINGTMFLCCRWLRASKENSGPWWLSFPQQWMVSCFVLVAR